MRLGVVANANIPVIHMLPATAARLGFKHGDYLQIEDVERCTRVVRSIKDCPVSQGMRPEYVYVDPMSAHYLTSDLHAEVRITRSEFPLDSP